MFELRLVSLLSRIMLSGELQMQTRRLEWLFTVPEAEASQRNARPCYRLFSRCAISGTRSGHGTSLPEGNVVIARCGHPMWRRRLTVERFAKLDHAAVIYRNQRWGLIDNELASRGRRRRLRLALPHCLSVLHAVASSDLVACIQESVVEEFGKDLNLRSCPEPLGLPPFVLRMVWHRQRDNDPAQVWLRKLIVSKLGHKAPTTFQAH